MIKILIADDEFLVRVGLRSTLHWEELGFLIVGEARNAREAIEIFDRESPDILLTDICMTGPSGLDLIATLRNKKPKLRTIILTHHEDFNFAKQAISLGVLDYILKSDLTSERLMAALERASASFLPSCCADADVPPVNGSSKKKSDAKFQKLIFGDFDTEEERNEVFAFFQNRFKGEAFLVGNIFVQWKLVENIGYDSKLRQVIEDVCNQLAPESSFTYYNLMLENRIYYMFNFNTEEFLAASFQNVVVRFVQLLMNNIKKYLNLNLSTGLSVVAEGIEQVPALFLQARTAQEEAFFDETHIGIYTEKEVEPDPESMKFDRKKLEMLLSSDMKEPLRDYIDALFEIEKKRKSYSGLQDLFRKFLDVANAIRKKMNGGEYSFNDFYSLHDFNSVKMYILDTIDLLEDQGKDLGGVNHSYIIKKSIRFIQDHYAENISLSSVAKCVEVSRSYLSFLFTQELGVNFSHYLTKTRIENAKKLLLESNMKIYEIAEKVGFDSPYYFSKVFKEIAGKSCKEYRSVFYEE